MRILMAYVRTWVMKAFQVCISSVYTEGRALEGMADRPLGGPHGSYLPVSCPVQPSPLEDEQDL